MRKSIKQKADKIISAFLIFMVLFSIQGEKVYAALDTLSPRISISSSAFNNNFFCGDDLILNYDFTTGVLEELNRVDINGKRLIINDDIYVKTFNKNEWIYAEKSLTDILEEIELGEDDFEFIKEIEQIVKNYTKTFKGTIWDISIPPDELFPDISGVAFVQPAFLLEEIILYGSIINKLGADEDALLEFFLKAFLIYKKEIDFTDKVFFADIVKLIRNKRTLSRKDVREIFDYLDKTYKLNLDTFPESWGSGEYFYIQIHKVKRWAALYKRNPKAISSLFKYYILKHEEAHLMLWPLYPVNRDWKYFSSPKQYYDYLKYFCLGDFEKFNKLEPDNPLLVRDSVQFFHQADIISISLDRANLGLEADWPFGINWVESLAYYTVFLNLIEMANGEDDLAIEALSQWIYFSQRTRHRALRVVISEQVKAEVNVLHRYLTDTQEHNLSSRASELECNFKVEDIKPLELFFHERLIDSSI